MKVKVNPVAPNSSKDKLQSTVAMLSVVRSNYLTDLQNLRNRYEPEIDALLQQVKQLSSNTPE